jgi:LPXTG-motif cell wall-anchored protein
MPSGWYGNADEQDNLPEPAPAGLLFENKDLIHHATDPIDLADMDKVTASFTATTAGKVVFKVETTGPYSTVITNADGKVWSTAMTYDQEGGQGHPVAHYSDLVGKDTKPGKAHFDGSSKVTTFGVGYWVAEGTTTVSEIKFHGTTYDLTCKIPTTPPTTTPTTAPTTPTAGTSQSASHSASASVSASSSAAQAAPTATAPVRGGGLPVTGASGWILFTAAALLGVGAVLLVATRRRRSSFTA